MNDEFNPAAAQAAKQSAMEQVDANANVLWKEFMTDLVYEICLTRPQFTPDDIQELYHQYGDNKPTTHEPRAMGPITARAAKAGWCVKAGVPAKNSNRRSHHAGLVQVWNSLLCGNQKMRQKSELWAGQQDIITALYNHDEQICVLRPGGGKTACALTAIRELIDDKVIRHALTTAPKRVCRSVWPDEIAQWEHTKDLRCAVLSGTPAERVALLASAAERELTIFGHDILEWMINQLDDLPADHPLFDLFIIDEISRFRNPTGERYKLLIKHIDRWKMVWGLSGTLRPSSGLDLFCPVRLVTRGKLWGRSFYQWQKTRFFPTDYNGYEWEERPGELDRINAEIASLTVTAEVPKRDAPTIVIDWVELPPAVRVEYKKMERRLFADIAKVDGEQERVVADSRAIAVGKLSQLCSGFMYDGDVTHRMHTIKQEWLKDLIETAVAPLLIIYEFVEDFQMLRELLGAKLPYLGAVVSDKQATANIEAWNRKELPFLALHPQSGGHGLNLQFGGSDQAWIGPIWSPEYWDQTIARLNRPGQERQVIVRVCAVRDSVDEMKLSRVHDKLTAQEAFDRYIQKAMKRAA